MAAEGVLSLTPWRLLLIDSLITANEKHIETPKQKFGHLVILLVERGSFGNSSVLGALVCTPVSDF